MNEIFLKLKNEKRMNIINAAADEFVKHGYDKASTNVMASEAGISKGSLFHYFESKKNLYLYLIDYSIEIIEKLYEEIDVHERDLFLRLENIGVQKLKIQIEYPHIFDFLKLAKDEHAQSVNDTVQTKFKSITSRGIERIYQNIDYSLFKEDLDIKKAIEVLNWTMFGFSEKALNDIESFQNIRTLGEKYLSEWRAYANFLRGMFYK